MRTPRDRSALPRRRTGRRAGRAAGGPPDRAAPAPAAGQGDAAAVEWSGLLAMDKPVGVTSHDVVDKVRRRLRVKSAGHLGPLHNAASGPGLIAPAAPRRPPRCRGVAGWREAL